MPPKCPRCLSSTNLEESNDQRSAQAAAFKCGHCGCTDLRLAPLPMQMDLSLWRALRHPDWRTFYADSMAKMNIAPEAVEEELRKRNFTAGQFAYQLDTPGFKALQAAMKPLLDKNGNVVGMDFTGSPSLDDLKKRMNSDLPLPTNKSLTQLFSNAERIEMQRMFRNDATFSSTSSDELHAAKALLEVYEPKSVQPCCLCIDEISLEFFSKEKSIAKLTCHGHHSDEGVAEAFFVRWNQWKCDAQIVDVKGFAKWLSAKLPANAS